MNDVITSAEPAVTLAGLALQILNDPCGYDLAGVRPGELIAASSMLSGAPLAEAWLDYLGAKRDELDIEDGVIDWRLIDDTLTCPERTEVAREIARQRSAEALEVLTGRSPR